MKNRFEIACRYKAEDKILLSASFNQNQDTPSLFIEVWDHAHKMGNDIMLYREDVEKLIAELEGFAEEAREIEDRQVTERFLALEEDRRERALDAKYDEERDRQRGL
jgi:hypothetical protein